MDKLVSEIESIIKSLSNIVVILKEEGNKDSKEKEEMPDKEEKVVTDPALQEILDFIKEKLDKDITLNPPGTPFDKPCCWDKPPPWPNYGIDIQD